MVWPSLEQSRLTDVFGEAGGGKRACQGVLGWEGHGVAVAGKKQCHNSVHGVAVAGKMQCHNSVHHRNLQHGHGTRMQGGHKGKGGGGRVLIIIIKICSGLTRWTSWPHSIPSCASQ